MKTNKLTTRKFIYSYYGKPVSFSEFQKEVQKDWQSAIDEYGEYSYGGYRAIEIDETEEEENN